MSSSNCLFTKNEVLKSKIRLAKYVHFILDVSAVLAAIFNNYTLSKEKKIQLAMMFLLKLEIKTTKTHILINIFIHGFN